MLLPLGVCGPICFGDVLFFLLHIIIFFLCPTLLSTPKRRKERERESEKGEERRGSRLGWAAQRTPAAAIRALGPCQSFLCV